MSWITSAAQLAAAGGVGSLLTQSMSRSGERQRLRADVRAELSTVEALRRHGRDADKAVRKAQFIELEAARRRLHVAALMAHLPREIVEEYDRLAMVAYASAQEFPAGPDESLVGLPIPVADCVAEAFDILCGLLWGPWVLRRLRYWRRIRGLRKLVRLNRELSGGENLRWEYGKP
jgi:hypothetical protein